MHWQRGFARDEAARPLVMASSRIHI